jgi:hypothetical protein
MKVDTTAKRIFVRQSWLNDVLMCPERARLAMKNPQMRMNSDATMIGTAVHHGIENFINTSEDVAFAEAELDEMVKVSVAEYQRLLTLPYKRTGVDETKILSYIESMCTAWYTNIMPFVEMGGRTEHRFVLPTGTNINGYDIYIEGTMDYISPSGVIWDWKTAGRSYSGAEKQKNAVQASMYAWAACIEGMVPDPDNIEFKYGVMIRQETPKAQVVSIHRNQEHVRWISQQVVSACTMGVSVGFDREWMLNDQGHLCSSKWCDFWSMCKGATVSDASLILK